jgi:hypothetical protein
MPTLGLFLLVSYLFLLYWGTGVNICNLRSVIEYMTKVTCFLREQLLCVMIILEPQWKPTLTPEPVCDYPVLHYCHHRLPLSMYST